MAENGDKERKDRSTNLWFPFLLILICIIVEYTSSRQLPVQGNLQGPRSVGTETFSVKNARTSLEELTAFGPRVTGSMVNEVTIPQYLQMKLRDLGKELPAGAKLEVERQNPSSNFYLDFLGGITNVYQNVTNVVVRLSWPESAPSSDFAVLLNAHFDSIPGSPGAADDGVGIACMIEALRILAHGPALRHDVIMLFNGAEESNHQAAHGFITQHRWAPAVKYVLNLEAIGSGGQEMVFQCNSGWLADFYAHHAPHPHASVVAHELFKNFLHRMASTDWSTLLKYGSAGVRGIDTAYIENGYVYHTSFDTAANVPDGTLVNTGENILHFTKALANAYEVPNPTSADEVDELGVFFDFLGLKMISYSGRNVTLLHSAAALLGVIVMALLSRSVDNMSWQKLQRMVLAEMYCFFTPVLVAVVFGLALYVLAPMRWYEGGIGMAALIFSPPVLLTILYVRGQATEGALNTASARILSGLLFPWTFFLVLGVVFQVMSVYMSCLWIVSTALALAAHTAFKHYILRNTLPPSRYLYSAECLYVVCLLPMLLQWVQITRLFLAMTVPLLGKSGTTVPSDPAVAALVAILLSGPAPLVLAHELTRPVVSKSQLKNGAMGIVAVLVFAMVFLRSYSVEKPKRLWIHHLHRTFVTHEHGPASSANTGADAPTIAIAQATRKVHTDCGMWVLGFDEQGLTPLHSLGVSRLDGRHKSAADCTIWDGDCYLKFPWYFSVSEVLRDSYYIPGECPEGIAPAEELKLSLSSTPATAAVAGTAAEGGDMRLVKVTIRGPTHMHLILKDDAQPRRITRWYIPTHAEHGAGVDAPIVSSVAQAETADAVQLRARLHAATGALESVSAIVDAAEVQNGEDEPLLRLVPTPMPRAEGVHYLSVGFGLCSPTEGCHQDVYLLVRGAAPVQVAVYGHYTDQKDDTAEIKALMNDLPQWAKGAEWTKFPSSIIQDSV